MVASMHDKTLIVATHGIGDLIMTCQSLRPLFNSGIRVSLLVSGEAEKSAAYYLLGDKLHECRSLIEFGARRISQLINIFSWLRKEQFASVIAQYGVSPYMFSVLSLMSGASRRVGWKGLGSFLNTESLEAKGQHKVLEQARLLSLLGLQYEVEDLYWSSDYRNIRNENARSKDKEFKIVLGPNSFAAEKHKRWPAQKYALLAARLVNELGAKVDIVGGPDEVHYCEYIASIAKVSNVTSLSGHLSLDQAFTHLKNVDVVVANCNATSHMAAVAGTPIVAIYGPTDPNLTGPFCKNLTKVRLSLECSPCYRRGYTSGCGNPVCIESIEVDTVFDAVTDILIDKPIIQKC